MILIVLNVHKILRADRTKEKHHRLSAGPSQSHQNGRIRMRQSHCVFSEACASHFVSRRGLTEPVRGGCSNNLNCKGVHPQPPLSDH
jgi:hypothetical protein